jgi:hypothetical protein
VLLIERKPFSNLSVDSFQVKIKNNENFNIVVKSNVITNDKAYIMKPFFFDSTLNPSLSESSELSPMMKSLQSINANSNDQTICEHSYKTFVPNDISIIDEYPETANKIHSNGLFPEQTSPEQISKINGSAMSLELIYNYNQDIIVHSMDQIESHKEEEFCIDDEMLIIGYKKIRRKHFDMTDLNNSLSPILLKILDFSGPDTSCLDYDQFDKVEESISPEYNVIKYGDFSTKRDVSVILDSNQFIPSNNLDVIESEFEEEILQEKKENEKRKKRKETGAFINRSEKDSGILMEGELLLPSLKKCYFKLIEKDLYCMLVY